MTSSNIDFIYQNRIFKINNPDSNETLLNYIRTKLKKTISYSPSLKLAPSNKGLSERPLLFNVVELSFSFLPEIE